MYLDLPGFVAGLDCATDAQALLDLAEEHQIVDLILDAQGDVVQLKQSAGLQGRHGGGHAGYRGSFVVSSQLRTALETSVKRVFLNPVLDWSQSWLRIKGRGAATPRHCDRDYVTNHTSMLQSGRQVGTLWVLLNDLPLNLLRFTSRLKFDRRSCSTACRAGDAVYFDVDQVHEATAGRSGQITRLSLDVRFLHDGLI